MDEVYDLDQCTRLNVAWQIRIMGFSRNILGISIFRGCYTIRNQRPPLNNFRSLKFKTPLEIWEGGTIFSGKANSQLFRNWDSVGRSSFKLNNFLPLHFKKVRANWKNNMKNPRNELKTTFWIISCKALSSVYLVKRKLKFVVNF